MQASAAQASAASCTYDEWIRLLDSGKLKSNQVDLYNCTEAVEQKPSTVAGATFFQRFAPKSAVDAATAAFEGKCNTFAQQSEDQQREEIQHLMDDFGIDYKQVPKCADATSQADCLARYSLANYRDQLRSMCAALANKQDYDNANAVCMDNPAANFPNFGRSLVDEFFTRGLTPGAMITPDQEIAWIQDENPIIDFAAAETKQQRDQTIIVSPAECYIVMFPTTSIAKEIWIKGSLYTVWRLLGTDHGGLYDDATTMVFRLTPRHHHRVYVPVTGQIVAIGQLGTRHLSVQRSVVQSSLTNVFTENVRDILYIDTLYFGVVAMVIVGAACVTSITFENPDLQEAFQQLEPGTAFEALKSTIDIVKRDLLMTFHYGGSTVLILVPASNTNYLLSRIVDASERQIETEIKIGQPVLFAALAEPRGARSAEAPARPPTITTTSGSTTTRPQLAVRTLAITAQPIAAQTSDRTRI